MAQTSDSQLEHDKTFMRRALRLAEKGRGYTSPNPLVGAVVVKNNKIVGEGFHREFGGHHAEVNALEAADDEAVGSTMYVTLEPCAHEGKTGPCVEKIYAAGVSRVVVAMRDPNPLVNGNGIQFLKSKGISVTENVLYDKSKQLNEGFLKFISQGIPYITLKVAQSLDGRIATSTGHSKWITAKQTRTLSHRIRTQHDAILVGIGTVLADDPELTVRYSTGVSPRRIVLDSQLRVPLDAKLLSVDLAPNTTFIATEVASREKVARIEERGATVHVLEGDSRGWVPMNQLWTAVAKMGITSVLIEGGSTVQTECLRSQYADRLIVFLAPKILGTGIDAIGDLGIRNVNSALQLHNVQIRRLEEDFMIVADF